MRRNAAKGMSVVASKQHYLARDWIDFSLEAEEPITNHASLKIVDGAVETGHGGENEYRPVELNLWTDAS